MTDTKNDLASLFEAAIEIRSSSERAEFVKRACGNNRRLRDELNRLLVAHAEAGKFLENPRFELNTAEVHAMSFPKQYVGYELIDRGSFGTVYKAKDPDGNAVAVKVLHDHLPHGVVQRFSREAARLNRVQHDNIVRYIESGEKDGRPYLVMEYITGNTLSQITTGEDDIIRVSAKIASGLHALHRESIIHRDIKPRNIITSVDFSTVKLVDLGMSRCLLDDTLTEIEHIIGTPLYLCPEQATRVEVDQRSDLFSLGAVIYYLITSKSPFDGPDTATILRNVIEKDIPPLAGSHGISPELSDIISRLLAKRPEDRFPDATSLISALKRLRPAIRGSSLPSTILSTGRQKTSQWKRSVLDKVRRRQPIEIVRSESTHKMKEQIRRSLATSNSIDHKFLYFDIEAVEKWSRITNADSYSLYHRCFNVCKKLCETAEWIEILTSSQKLRILDLGVGTGDKDNWLVRNACQANTNVELLLLDSSFPMLELTVEQLDNDINRFSELTAVKGDFYHLRESIGQDLEKDCETTRNIFLMLGGTFGNLDEGAFLNEVRRVSSREDILVLAVECFTDRSQIEDLLLQTYNIAEVKSLAALSVRHIEPELSEADIVKDVSVRIVADDSDGSSVPGAVSSEIIWTENTNAIRLAKSTRYRKQELIDFVGRAGFELVFEVQEPVKVCPASTFSYLILTPQGVDS